MRAGSNECTRIWLHIISFAARVFDSDLSIHFSIMYLIELAVEVSNTFFAKSKGY